MVLTASSSSAVKVEAMMGRICFRYEKDRSEKERKRGRREGGRKEKEQDGGWKAKNEVSEEGVSLSSSMDVGRSIARSKAERRGACYVREGEGGGGRRGEGGCWRWKPEPREISRRFEDSASSTSPFQNKK